MVSRVISVTRSNRAYKLLNMFNYCWFSHFYPQLWINRVYLITFEGWKFGFVELCMGISGTITVFVLAKFGAESLSCTDVLSGVLTGSTLTATACTGLFTSAFTVGACTCLFNAINSKLGIDFLLANATDAPIINETAIIGKRAETLMYVSFNEVLNNGAFRATHGL